jgi:hypothetical protein
MKRIFWLVTGLACAYASLSFAESKLEKPNAMKNSPGIAQPGAKLGQPNLQASGKGGEKGGPNDPKLKQIKIDQETARLQASGKGGEKGGPNDPKLKQIKIDQETARLQAGTKGGKPGNVKNQ